MIRRLLLSFILVLPSILISQEDQKLKGDLLIGSVVTDLISGSYGIYSEYNLPESKFSIFLSPSIKAGQFNSETLVFNSNKEPWYDPFTKQVISDDVEFLGFGLDLGFKYYLEGYQFQSNYLGDNFRSYISFRTGFKNVKMNYYTEGWLEADDQTLIPGIIWQDLIVDQFSFDLSYGEARLFFNKLVLDYYFGYGLRFVNKRPKEAEIEDLEDNIFTKGGSNFIVGIRLSYLIRN